MANPIVSSVPQEVCQTLSGLDANNVGSVLSEELVDAGIDPSAVSVVGYDAEPNPRSYSPLQQSDVMDGGEPLFLPPGLMFLVVERTRCADGWWLRLASGKRWVPEKIKDQAVCISCNPSVSEATESLRSLRLDKKPSSIVERNARLVCSQLSKSAALR
eukprot:s729_g7.t1